MSETDLTNVDNFSIPELLDILNVGIDFTDTDLSRDNIENSCNNFIAQFKVKNNSKMVQFFTDVKDKLLDYLDEIDANNETPNDVIEDTDWTALSNQKKTVEDNKKITERKQKVKTFDDQKFAMEREQLGISNQVAVPVAQDKLNPNLQNINSRFVNIDSQFRQSSSIKESSSTDFTLDLSDRLKDVLSIYLYSIQIPFTWYVIDNQYGNNCFWVTNAGNTFKISVTNGNYTPATFVTELNTQFSNSGFVSSVAPVSYNSINAKLTINLQDSLDPSGNIISGIPPSSQADEYSPYFTFFDITGSKTPFQSTSSTCISEERKFTSTLGWLMGYRSPLLPIYDNSGNTADAVIDLYGPKYLILVVDDYKQNHINNGIVNISRSSNVLPMPAYYKPTMPKTCVTPAPLGANNLQDIMNQLISSGNTDLMLSEKLLYSYNETQSVLPSEPRTLTQAQLYTINEISKQRGNTTSFRLNAPSASDTLALIPIKRANNVATGEMYVDFSGSLQDNKRVYFGPVDIDRFHIKLLDDKGYELNLNGAEWSFTLVAETLYQY